MTIYNFDLESFSDLDLRKCGSYAYARHHSTDVLCAAWRGDDGSKGVWRPGLPATLVIRPGDEVHGYNIISFDAEMWRWVLHRKYGWVWPGYDVFRDTMSRAAYANLPGALGEVAIALGTKAKDAIGAKLMQRLCKPAHEVIGNDDPRRLHTAANLERLSLYCAEDVEAEAALSPHLPELPPDEVKAERITHTMNRRGWRVDLDLVRRLRELALIHGDVLRARMASASRGAVERETNLAAIAAFARSRGVAVGEGRGSMDAEAVDGFLAQPDLDPDVRVVLDVRRQLGRSALAKLDRILTCVCDDQRVRGLIQYYGAHQTGRDAGRLVQIQNLPRGIFQGARSYADALATVRHGSPADAYDLLRMCYERPDVAVTDVLSSLIRPCFIASEGRNLHVSDYSAIEGRVLAWLAGEERILDAYRRGLRLYCVAAAGIFNEPYEVINANRGSDPRYKHMDMVGKVVELACGYQGAIGAFKAMAGAYGLVLPDEQINQIVKAWRASRPLTVKFWYDCGDAAIEAVRNPGKIITVGRILFRFDGVHLKIRLPSGRCLWYRNARVRPKQTPVGERDALFFYGEGLNGRYCLEDTYGGKIVENITQAVSRDLLMGGAIKAEDEGVEVVARVHDELVADHPGDDKHLLEQIMGVMPAWADGLPMRAEAFVSPFYRK